jgi:hypothetical protein
LLKTWAVHDIEVIEVRAVVLAVSEQPDQPLRIEVIDGLNPVEE